VRAKLVKQTCLSIGI